MKNENEPKLPCGECCKLEISCCHNPQILFTMTDLDKLITTDENIMQDRTVLKGEIPGMVYIINRPPEGVRDMKLEYCTFYDEEKQNCSIYDNRPDVCKTYGDPKYNSCPYEDYSEPGELTELQETNPDLAHSLHGTANTNPEAFLNDYINPFVESFKISDPQYMEWWEKLPNPNFIRNQALMDSLDLVELAKVNKEGQR